MISLIFDTETTGKANFKIPDPTIQPYPVQMACVLAQDNKIMSMASVIINPEVPMDQEAAEVHGILPETIAKLGISLRAAAGIFINFLNKTDRIVAHSIDFDIIITEAMIYRAQVDYDMSKFRQVPRVCTMLSSTDVCRIPGKYGFKWPKLEEAYKILVDPAGFKGAHDALNDVVACWKILQKLEEKELPLKRGKR